MGVGREKGKEEEKKLASARFEKGRFACFCSVFVTRFVVRDSW